MRFLFPFLLVFTFVGCQHAPANTTPQAAIAHYGSDIITGVNAVRNAVVAATDATPPVLSVDKALPVMNNLRKANELGTKLSGLLKLYDTATTLEKQSLAGQIQTLLSEITAAVATAGTNDLPAQLLTQTTALIANVSNTVNLIRSAAQLAPAS